MAKLDFKKLIEPVSEEEPCGPDLDEAFDMDYMNFVALIEGRLPGSYFSFDPSSMDFEGDYEQFAEFLNRSRDIRLLVPLAQYKILERDLEGFVDAVETIHVLLRDFWEDVHPKGFDGDYMLRMAPLYTLDDMPTAVLPLQGATLLTSRRAGRITLRSILLSEGELSPRDEEEVLDSATLDTAFAETDEADIEKLKDLAIRLRDALAGIRKVCIENAGFDSAVNLDRLPAAVERMIEAINDRTGGGDEQAEGAADGEGGATGEGGRPALSVGAITNRAEVADALYAAARYYALNEPTSPVQLILRQAERLVEGNFYDIIYELLPESYSYSKLRLGTTPFFEIQLDKMNSANPAPDYTSPVRPGSETDTSSSSWESVDDEEDETSEPYEEGAEEGAGDGAQKPPEEEAAAEEAPADDGWGVSEGEEEPAEEAAAEEAPADDGWGVSGDEEAGGEETPAEDGGEEEAAEAPADDGWGMSGDDETGGETDDGSSEEAEAEAESESEPAAAAVAPEPERRVFEAHTRQDAVALMDKVVAYYRAMEPSSPVPLLVQRAMDMTSRSFMDILTDMLPSGTLKTPEQDY